MHSSSTRISVPSRRFRLLSLAISLITAIALALAGTAQAAAPGSLDTSFDGDGKKLVNLGGFDDGIQLLVQRDSKLLVVGNSTLVSGSGQSITVTTRIALTRLNPNGTLDRSFGGGDAKVTTNPTDADDSAVSAALAGDGKIIVLSERFNLREERFQSLGYTLLRYLPDGTLDKSFSRDGKVLGSFGGDFQAATDVAVQRDGKILVTGSKGDDESEGGFELVRYNANGALDTSFGNRGRVSTRVGEFSTPSAVTLQSDGRIVVVGSTNQGERSAVGIVRYNPSGRLDTSFGKGGKVVDVSPTEDEGIFPTDVLVQPNGRIAVSGIFIRVNRTTQDFSLNFALLRYLGNGKVDTAFGGGDGRVFTNFDKFDFASSLALQPDGKIVVAGAAGFFNLDNESVTSRSIRSHMRGSRFATSEATAPREERFDFALARYTSGGRLDTSFGNNGKVITRFGRGSSFGSSVGIQGGGTSQTGQTEGGGKIVLAGGAEARDGGDFAIARYNR